MTLSLHRIDMRTGWRGLGAGFETEVPGAASSSAVFPFSHADIPRRRRAIYLRLVNSISRALDYAAGGFHVSVDRGLAQKSNEIRAMWGQAAGKYAEAFKAGLIAGTPVESVKAMIAEANNVADQAYKAEGVSPPRDPLAKTPEPPVHLSRGKKWGMLGAAAAGIGLLALWGREPKGSKKGTTRRHSGAHTSASRHM